MNWQRRPQAYKTLQFTQKITTAFLSTYTFDTSPPRLFPSLISGYDWSGAFGKGVFLIWGGPMVHETISSAAHCFSLRPRPKELLLIFPEFGAFRLPRNGLLLVRRSNSITFSTICITLPCFSCSVFAFEQITTIHPKPLDWTLFALTGSTLWNVTSEALS